MPNKPIDPNAPGSATSKEIADWVATHTVIGESSVPPGGTTGQVLTKKSNTDADVDWENAAGSGGVAVATFIQPGTLSTGVGAAAFIFPFSAVILGVAASVGTAPTGASVICDVNKNGTTIFTTQGNRPTIAVSTTKTTTMPAPNVSSVAQFDTLSVDIDQVGSTITGADLVVVVSFNSA